MRVRAIKQLLLSVRCYEAKNGVPIRKWREMDFHEKRRSEIDNAEKEDKDRRNSFGKGVQK